MQPLLSRCPVCASALEVHRLACAACGTAIEGRFDAGPFAGLAPEQLDFVLTFVRCEGKFTRMQGEMGLSYPTLRSRLLEVIASLGFEPGAEEVAGLAEDERRRILAELDEGRITPDEAVRLLRGVEG